MYNGCHEHFDGCKAFSLIAVNIEILQCHWCVMVHDGCTDFNCPCIATG